MFYTCEGVRSRTSGSHKRTGHLGTQEFVTQIAPEMDTPLERSLVLSALAMALTNRQPQAGLLCHSDRGSQYASGDYQKALSDAGIVCSTIRKGNCWDNAPTKSFFATLQRECVYRYRFATRSEARTTVFRYSEF